MLLTIINMDYKVLKEHEIPQYVLRRIREAVEKGLNPEVSLLSDSEISQLPENKSRVIFDEYKFDIETSEYRLRQI